MRTKLPILFVLILIAFGAGYVLSQGKNNGSEKITTTTENNPNQSATNQTTNAALAELVTYTLPDRWEEKSCAGSQASFIIPTGSTLNCDSKPAAPIRLAVDSGNNTDCNQLQNQSQVKKHICSSLFINGKKTLKTSTEYLDSGEYGKAMVEDAYYFDSGSGVVKAEYVHTPEDTQHQSDFDELVNSLNSK